MRLLFVVGSWASSFKSSKARTSSSSVSTVHWDLTFVNSCISVCWPSNSRTSSWISGTLVWTVRFKIKSKNFIFCFKNDLKFPTTGNCTAADEAVLPSAANDLWLFSAFRFHFWHLFVVRLVFHICFSFYGCYWEDEKSKIIHIDHFWWSCPTWCSRRFVALWPAGLDYSSAYKSTPAIDIGTST